jgi:hypothetical protein
VCVIDDSYFDGVRWHLNVVLICISFMARGVEYFFIHLLAICTSACNYICSESLSQRTHSPTIQEEPENQQIKKRKAVRRSK